MVEDIKMGETSFLLFTITYIVSSFVIASRDNEVLLIDYSVVTLNNGVL
jgi:hypothetical protein